MFRSHLALAILAGGVLFLGRSLGADLDPAGEDEQMLQKAGIGTDGPALVEFFRKRAQPDTDQEKVKDLIARLGDGSFQVRKKAEDELVALGSKALPQLRQAAQGHDVAMVRRVKDCLKRIDPASEDTLAGAAARVMALRKPEGAAEALLNYLAVTADDAIIQEVRETLKEVAFREGVPDRALVKGLDDKLPVRRAAAAEALARAGGYQQIAEVRRLLKDPEPLVRLRLAVALVEFRDQEAFPVLIALLTELPPSQAEEAQGCLRDLAGDLAPATLLGSDPTTRQKCQEAWKEWWAKTDGSELLDLYRKATPREADRVKIMALVTQLGDDDFAVREKASADLVALGAAATPILRLALKDGDVEIVHRAENCLKLIEKGPGNLIPAAAARVVALRKPEGTAGVLLAYLPVAEAEQQADEIQSALTALALRDGKPDQTLVEALTDKVAVRRAAAAVALCRASPVNSLPQVRPLLKDGEPLVRLRVALALAERKDREAFPVLIALLDQVPAAQLWQAEEMLRRLAGNDAPAVGLGSDDPSARKCREAWQAWWQEQGAKVDLARLDSTPRLLGYTLITLLDSPRGGGRVMEITSDGKPRWQIEGLAYPFDAQVLPGNRVLVAEYQGGRVTERNFKGEILWQKPVNLPINVQRLPNGNTFIACHQQVLEVDRNGKETTFSNQPPQGIMGARKLPDGQIACVLQGGIYVRMDRNGKELTRFPVYQSSLGGFNILGNGHLLVPQYANAKVVEFDADGKVVWETPAQFPVSAARLPNGHTLIANQSSSTVVEVDRAGNKLWTYKVEGRPWQVRRR